MPRKICLKCLNIDHFGGAKHCSYDGEELVEFTLMCECGVGINPNFWPRMFPPFGKRITNKHCPQCGRDITKPVESYLKELKAARSQGV